MVGERIKASTLYEHVDGDVEGVKPAPNSEASVLRRSTRRCWLAQARVKIAGSAAELRLPTRRSEPKAYCTITTIESGHLSQVFGTKLNRSPRSLVTTKRRLRNFPGDFRIYSDFFSLAGRVSVQVTQSSPYTLPMSTADLYGSSGHLNSRKRRLTNCLG